MKIRKTRKKSVVVRQGKKALQPPRIHGFPKDWRDRIRADLSAQLEAGGTLYGVRSDGAYIARTRDGDRVLRHPEKKSS